MALALLVVPGLMVLLAMLALFSPATALAVILVSALVYLTLYPARSSPSPLVACDDTAGANGLHQAKSPVDSDYFQSYKPVDETPVDEPPDTDVLEPVIEFRASAEPVPATDVTPTVKADDPWNHPDLKFRQMEKAWYKGVESDVDKQRREYRKHLMTRRQLDVDGGKWTPEDRAQLRAARIAAMTRLEARLKPDQATVYEMPACETRCDNPPVAVGDYDDLMLLNTRRLGMDGSGYLPCLLRSKQF